MSSAKNPTPFREQLALSCHRADQVRKFPEALETETWKKDMGVDYPTSPLYKCDWEAYLVEAAGLIAQMGEAEATELRDKNVRLWVGHLGLDIHQGEPVPWQVVLVSDRVLTPEEEAYALTLEKELGR